jgi:hypothetical protein
MAALTCPHCGASAHVMEYCDGHGQCDVESYHTFQIGGETATQVARLSPGGAGAGKFAAYSAGRRGPHDAADVSSIPDDELLGRAVRACKSRRRTRQQMVQEYFALGSTYAAQLCARFGLNPDEVVK